VKRQHPIDLLPAALRARANAGIAASRNVAYALLGLIIVVATAGHSHVLEGRAQARFAAVSDHADQLDRNERQAAAMQQEMDRLIAEIARHQQVELPVDLSSVIATIVEIMPESISFDRIYIEADQTRRAGLPARAVDRDQPIRLLVGEIAGIARTDLDIADFVSALSRVPPFEEVSLDFSRQRLVNEEPAREFRVSFVIDFTRRYEVLTMESGSAASGGRP
jgi:hypothetical protein